jgi:hypothetical protein
LRLAPATGHTIGADQRAPDIPGPGSNVRQLRDDAIGPPTEGPLTEHDRMLLAAASQIHQDARNEGVYLSQAGLARQLRARGHNRQSAPSLARQRHRAGGTASAGRVMLAA